MTRYSVPVLFLLVVCLACLVQAASAATIFIAASDSSDVSKSQASFVCDGANDQVQIQQALNTAGPSGIVMLSEGTFHTVGSITIPGQVTLSGQGPDKTVLSMTGYGYIYYALWGRDVRHNAFLDVGSDNAVLKDFTVTNFGWIHITASNILLENVTVRDSFNTPQGGDLKINAFAAFGVNLQGQDLHDITFVNCNAIRVGTFGFRNDNIDDSPTLGGHPANTLSNLKYINCEANTCGSGVYPDNTDMSRGWEIYASGWDAQEFIKVDGVLMQDCRAINNWMNGIHFEGRDGYNILVENCRAVNNGNRKVAVWGMDSLHSGIGFRGGRNAVWRNCYAENNGNYGFAYIGIWNTRIENCVDNGSGTGYFMDSSLIPRTYTNNVFANCTSLNAKNYGFLMDGTYKCYIYDGRVVNAGGDGTYLNYRTDATTYTTFDITAVGGVSPQIINTGGTGNIYTCVFDTVTATPKPDLTVTGVAWTPSEVFDGNAVTFRATIRNDGEGPTPAGTVHRVGFEVDGVEVAYSTTQTASIAPGEYVVVSANGGDGGTAAWTATGGAHTVVASVDSANLIPESDETNNAFQTALTVAAASQPDLIVTAVAWSPAAPAAGDAVTFRATIKNIGTGPTPDGVIHGVGFHLDGGSTVTYASSYTASLAPGASVEVVADGGAVSPDIATWTAVEGTYNLSAWVDTPNRIIESDETNNTDCTATLVVAASQPDLVVSGVTWSPVSAIEGDAVIFRATITNAGTAATPDGVVHRVGFAIGGTEVASSADRLASLAPGASVEVTAGSAWTAAAGSHTVVASVDTANLITESDEGNNAFQAGLVISNGQPDLVVTAVAWSPAAPAAGDAVTFRATIKNIGTGPSPDGVIHGVGFHLDGGQTVTYASEHTASLAPGESVEVVADGSAVSPDIATWTAVAGTYNLSAWVDTPDRIVESDETNNTDCFIMLTVAAAPVELTGDIDRNGVVDAADVALVVEMVLGTVPLDLRADFNGNGTVDIGDAARIDGYVSGRLSSL